MLNRFGKWNYLSGRTLFYADRVRNKVRNKYNVPISMALKQKAGAKRCNSYQLFDAENVQEKKKSDKKF